MATKSYTVTELKAGGHVYEWVGLANGDDGQPLEAGNQPDRSIHFSGTFGAGGAVVLEGSNNASSYVTLTDPQGNNISKSAEGLEAVTEITRLIRPRVTGGDGTTSITASLFIKK
jgi:hypothetical protein